MRTICFARAGALLVASFFLASPVAAQGHADTRRCQNGVAKRTSELAKKSARAIADCHRRRLKGKVAEENDCGDLAAGHTDATGRVARAAADLLAHLGDPDGRCDGVVPDGLDACPSPCDGTVPSLTVLEDVADCLVCLNTAEVEAMSRMSLGTPSVMLEADEAGCLAKLGREQARHLGRVMARRTDCYRELEGPDATKCAAAFIPEVSRGRQRGEMNIADRCAPADLAAVDSCASSQPDLSECVLDEAESAAERLFAATRDFASPWAARCQLVRDGYGPAGRTEIDVEIVATGLRVPWGIAWLPNGDMLVTERAGVVLRVDPESGVVGAAVARIAVAAAGEGGLLGIATHPQFSSNRFFYVYYTRFAPAVGAENVVERWILAEDELSAAADTVLLSGIPARVFHNGGRLRFGPDGMLYIGTGDAGVPEASQDTGSLAGKILRVADDGSIPDDNPFPGSATWVYGLRNTQGFDWLADGTLVITDHGPSGAAVEDGRRGHDELNVGGPGDNFGWPDIYACEDDAGMQPPAMTWKNAMPPGGVAVYTGSEIPEWRGDAFMGVLGVGANIGHLHRIRLSDNGNVEISETYLRGDGGFGRLRDVIMGPDGGLYVTTSDCDGRGACGDGDVILRVGRR